METSTKMSSKSQSYANPSQKDKKKFLEQRTFIVANWLILSYDVGGYGILFTWDSKELLAL
jgi:hypothetical protein